MNKTRMLAARLTAPVHHPSWERLALAPEMPVTARLPKKCLIEFFFYAFHCGDIGALPVGHRFR